MNGSWYKNVTYAKARNKEAKKKKQAQGVIWEYKSRLQVWPCRTPWVCRPNFLWHEIITWISMKTHWAALKASTQQSSFPAAKIVSITDDGFIFSCAERDTNIRDQSVIKQSFFPPHKKNDASSQDTRKPPVCQGLNTQKLLGQSYLSNIWNTHTPWAANSHFTFN